MTDLDHRLREHLAYAYENAPAVKNIFDQRGLRPTDIQTVADLAKLPIISKDDFSAMQQAHPPFGGWLAVPLSQLDRIYMSPGPIYDPHSGKSSAVGDDATVTLKAAGFGEGDIVINAFLYHLVPAGLLFDEALLAAGATVVPLGPGNTEIHVKVMLDLQVTGYVGTPSFLSIILDKAAEMGIPKEKLALKKAFFSAEPYPPSLREKFEQTYGLQTAQAYATADLGIIAYQLFGQQDFTIPDNQIVELVDPNTGEPVEEGTPGEVVVTKFDRVYPLLRFGTGDMAVMIPGTGRLYGLVGRSGDAIKVRGMFLHPNQIRAVMNNFPEVKNMQAIITRDGVRDIVTLHVVTADGNANLENKRDAIKSALQQFARLSINEIKFVDTVEGERMIVDKRTWD
ncbi:MAG: CoF synthetase [Phototrophicales bacterium]|nr:MAG: CoF synthetase [Phototrophicales bacterium]